MTESKSPHRKGSCLKIGLIAVLVLVIGAGALWAWNNRPISPVTLNAEEKVIVAEKVESLDRANPEYQPGSKEIRFTEREINGLLNQHTSFGETIELELADNAIYARIQTDLDPDLPIAGGKTLKARAKVLVDMAGEKPTLILDDLTVWGISLPNDWLGGLKGKNFLEELFDGKAELSGIDTIQVQNGEIYIKLKD